MYPLNIQSIVLFAKPVILVVTLLLTGCGPATTVQESDEYKFDDIAAQLAAEELASKNEAEK